MIRMGFEVARSYIPQAKLALVLGAWAFRSARRQRRAVGGERQACDAARPAPEVTNPRAVGRVKQGRLPAPVR